MATSPLRKSSNSKSEFLWIIPFCFHITLLLLCGYFHFYRLQIDDIMRNEGLIKAAFGGSWRYLTIWGQYLTIFYVFLSCMHDVTHLFDSNWKKDIRKYVHYLFYPICTLTTIIAILFWSIFCIDKDLMIPPKMRPFYPMILNVFQHGGSGIILWMDALICSKRVYHKTMHYLTTVFVGLIYQSWSVICAVINGFQAYPFLDHLTLKQHLIFFSGVLIIGFLVQSVTMFIIEKLHHQKDRIKIS